MALPRKTFALVCSALAGGALVTLAPHAAAAGSAACNGGSLTITTSPIGMAPGPVNGDISGTVTGCDISGFQGTFTGNGNCDDVNVNVDADLIWNNGDRTHVSGPFHVPGGPTPPAASNTLNVTSGEGSTLAVNTGPIDNAGALAADCMASNARTLTVPLTSVVLS
ncbi:hypothetical protein VMT65_28785 [Nocardia sp. CDC153]|uniref:hypothetical protein n=1 Tax=Nocardia sp. CDC153 TaxID=3112167 RepID=UPI002DBB26B5|nr:hypothetical protein [Nocardia sp. CDC153]MEC3957062.1 hypothetical protein [Nocardia sp. CDC153]